MRTGIQRLLNLVVLTAIVVSISSPATSQDLPPVATTDATVFVGRIDLEQIDPENFSAAAKAILGELAPMADPPLQGVQRFRQELDRLGVRRWARVALIPDDAAQAGLFDLQLLAFRAGIDRETAAKQIVESWYPEPIREYIQTKWLDDWLGIHGTIEPLPAAAKPGPHSKRIAAALTSLGKRPGVVLVPSEKALKMVAPLVGSLKTAGLPASIHVVADDVLSAEWGSAAAKIDAKPAVKITLQMADEAQATKLAADYAAMSKDLARLTKQLPAKPEDAPPSPAAMAGDLMVYAQTLKPQAKGTQVIIVLDQQAIGRTVETFVMPALKAAQVAARRNLSANRMKSLALLVMEYEQTKKKFPDKIEDVKSLLSGTDAEREAEFNALLTNARTEQNPGYVYTKPAKSLRDLKTSSHKTVILHELKEGKPDADGLLGYLDGSIRTRADDAQEALERESDADR